MRISDGSSDLGSSDLVDDAYAPGTDVSTRSIGERDDNTSLTWLAGTVALQRLNRPADAQRMFEKYGRAAQSPRTITKGLYWAGRAAQAAGQAAQANAYFQEAATHFDPFYGQQNGRASCRERVCPCG